jgi:filamentous hemagglutinin family protein
MTKNKIAWKLKLTSNLVLSGILVAVSGNGVFAQITPDRTLGNESSVVKPNRDIKGIPSNRIDGGARRGGNLFHSFRSFNVEEGRGAYFRNPAGVENILSRVTGGNPSEILGRLGVIGGNANLFLINPNGIIFGDNASLDINGSFVATTADAIGFGDRGLFSATEPNAPGLLNINPSAFLFNQIASARGAIENNSIAPAGLDSSEQINAVGLRVPDGQSLLLLGGEVNMNAGGLFVFGGRVELGGLNEEGTVGLDIEGRDLRLSFPDNVSRADVSLTNGAEVNVRSDNGGSIVINSQNLSFFNSSKLRAGIASGLGTVNSKAGDIAIDAAEVITLTDESFIANVVQPEAVGQSGDINLQAESIFLNDGSYLITSSFGQGSAGNLIVNALDEIGVSGASSDGSEFSRLTTQTEGSANAGNLAITTKRLTIENGGQISTATDSPDSTGDAGDLTVNASDEVRVSGASLDGSEFSRLTTRTESSGDAGNLTINTGNFVVENGAQVSSGNNSTTSTGNAGNLTVNALGEVRVSGESFDGSEFSRLTTRTLGEGNAGNLTINTGNFIVENGAQVSSGTNDFSAGNAGNSIVNALDEVRVSGASSDGEVLSRLTTRTQGEGDAGDLTITTSDLVIENGGQVYSGTADSLITGNAGNLIVNASDEVRVSGASPIVLDEDLNLSRLTTRTESSGDAGNLTIDTKNLIIENGAQVSSGTNKFTTTGNAGNLTVNASDEVRVSGASVIDDRTNLSRLTARTEGSGDAGELTINTKNLIIENGAQVSSGSDGQTFIGEPGNQSEIPTTGNAGNLTVNALDEVRVSGALVLDDETIRSGLSARTEGSGDAGVLTITTRKLLIQDGGRVTSESFKEGKAGLLTVRASDAIELSGTSIPGKSSLLSVETTGMGNAGDLTLETRQLSIEDGGQVSSRSEGTGIAGNIKIEANFLALEGSSISAETFSTDGGNIDLDVQNLLTLRNGSQISTTAGTNQAGGNGGNIKIDTPFLIAIPQENSDITANAFEGSGGIVKIVEPQGIFGIEERDRQTDFSDITASSELGLQGTVEIDDPNTDPSRTLVNLPIQPVEAEVLQACQPSNNQEQSEFVITGRGGLPPTPQEELNTNSTNIDWVSLKPNVAAQERTREQRQENLPNSSSLETNNTTTSKQIVEAQGMVVNSNGKIVLTAQNSDAPELVPNFCKGLQNN